MNHRRRHFQTGTNDVGISAKPSHAWILVGLGLGILGLLFLIDRRVAGLFANSLLLASLSALVALPIGVIVGVLLGRTDIPFRRAILVSLIAMTLMPLILTTSAWDAAFGRLGWWQWIAKGDFVGRMIGGIFAASWVHGFAAMPWVVLIASVASRQSQYEQEDAARLETGTWSAVWRLSLSQWAGLIAIGYLSVIVLTFGEIVVSDLYQVRTVAEEVYLGIPLARMFGNGQGLNPLDDTVGSGWLLRPSGIATLLWVSGCGIYVFAQVGPVVENATRSQARLVRLGRWKLPAFLFALAVALLVVVVPVVNLVIRAGFRVQAGPEGGVPSWSAKSAVEVILEVPSQYTSELVWSAVIATVATILIVLFWGTISWSVFRRARASWLMIFVASGALAIPGPAIGTMLIGILNHDHPLMIFVYDRTVVPPALACVMRIGPWAAIMCWAVFHTMDETQFDLATSEGMGRWRQLVHLVIPQRWALLLATIGAVWLLSFGELSASILVIPPGIETLPRTVFGQLHAGVYDQVAALCLFQWAIFFGVSFGIVMFWNLLRTKTARLENESNT